MLYEFQKDNFTINTNPDLLDIDVIHSYLSGSYWAQGIARESISRSIENSLCFGLFDDGQQIGFARVLTDYARFAYLMDIFVLETYQGQGLGKWFVTCILSCPELQGICTMMLATKDAHEFYRKFGFEALNNPGKFMEKRAGGE